MPNDFKIFMVFTLPAGDQRMPLVNLNSNKCLEVMFLCIRMDVCMHICMKSDVSFQNPPNTVKLVMEAICIMLNSKPDRKPDSTGKMVDDYWGGSLKLLGDLKLLDRLRGFDKDNIPPANMKKLREKLAFFTKIRFNLLHIYIAPLEENLVGDAFYLTQ